MLTIKKDFCVVALQVVKYSTVPFNAAGGPQSSPSTNAASAQYAQYAMWYAMQQQAAAAAAANSSNPAGAAALASGASSGNASTSPALGTGGQDLAANYQNYLLQYQQQNSNASQQALAGMGGSSTAPSGVPPPTVGVPPLVEAQRAHKQAPPRTPRSISVTRISNQVRSDK